MSGVPIAAALALDDESEPARAGPALLGRRLVVCGSTTVLLLVSDALSPLQLPNEPWLAPGLVAVIVAVVALWGAAPIHRAARRALGDGVVSADVLASVAVLAALGLVLVTLALSAAGGGSPMPPPVLPPLATPGPLSVPLPGTALLPLPAEAAAAIATAALAVHYLTSFCVLDLLACKEIQYTERRGTTGWVAAEVLVAAGVLGFWWTVVGPEGGVAAVVAVLVVASAGPLGLARSAALQAGSSAADRLGIGWHDPAEALDLRRVDIAVVDCDGTLTVGVPQLLRVVATGDVEPERALGLMGSLLARADDPVARAVVSACRDHGIRLASVEVQADSGRHGVRGVVDGWTGTGTGGSTEEAQLSRSDRRTGRQGGVGRVVMTVGHENFLRRWRLDVPAALAPLCAEVAVAGHHALLAGWDGEARVVVVVADAVRPTAVAAVEALRRAGARPVVLSGAGRQIVEAVAALAGIDQAAGELAPGDKAEIVRRYRARGRTVLVLADPVVDAEALAAADLAVVPAPRADLWTVVDTVSLLRHTRRTWRANQALALVVPVVGLPLAAAGMLDPLLGAAATVLSASLVTLNSQRLRRHRSARPPEHRRRGATPAAPHVSRPQVPHRQPTPEPTTAST